jgi:RNA polymerase sigma-70 factor (ECF subfamily)
MQANELKLILEGCKRQERLAQRLLFQRFYNFGMGLCMRYAANKEEAQEMLNDGFYKVFTKIDQYKMEFPFSPWLRTVIVHAAIDYHRRKKAFLVSDIEEEVEELFTDNSAFDNLVYEDIIKVIQQLTPAYRTVFNLYVIEGYKHFEIAAQLNISEGTSKSNLARAKKKLQSLLKPIRETKLN